MVLQRCYKCFAKGFERFAKGYKCFAKGFEKGFREKRCCHVRFYKVQLFLLVVGSIVFILTLGKPKIDGVLVTYQLLIGSSVMTLANSSIKWLKVINLLVSLSSVGYLIFISKGILLTYAEGYDTSLIWTVIVFAIVVPILVSAYKSVSDTL